MKTYLDHAAVTVADIGWTMKLFEGVHGIEGKPEKWVQLPDGLTLEMFQAKEGAIDAALGNKMK